MTEIVPAPPLSREEAVAAALPGGDPTWLAALRQSAVAAYQEAPWPSSTRDEDWRRTPQIDRLDPASYGSVAPQGADLPSYLALALDSELASPQVAATVVADQRGNLQGPWSGAGPDNSLQPLGRGLGGEGWDQLLGRVAAPGLRKFISLNTARFVGGGVIRVGRNQQLPGYLRLVHGVSGGSASFPRTVIDVEEGASATVVEEWVSDQERNLLAPVVEIRLGRGAHLTHVISQRCGDQTVVQSTVRAEAARDSSYDVRWAMLGSSWQKSYFDVIMAGDGSEAKLCGLFVGRASQHADIQTLQDHIGQAAVSDLIYRTAVADRSHSIYSGLIRVEEGAQKTNAYVQNRNLLLSPLAKADSNPTLEILANDVRCTHGSTAGRIDDDQLFYCQSRGIPLDQARQLVVEGFFADVLDSFPEGSVRDAARGWALTELEELARSGALAGPSSARAG